MPKIIMSPEQSNFNTTKIIEFIPTRKLQKDFQIIETKHQHEPNHLIHSNEPIRNKINSEPSSISNLNQSSLFDNGILSDNKE